MNTLIIIWLAFNAVIGLPIIGIAIYLKAKDLRSKKGGRVSDRQTNTAAALELKQAA